MRSRRKIAAIAALLAAELSLLGMRQYAVIRRLPDVPLRGFDANAVTTSRAAYPLGVPDSSLAVVGAGALIALATAGGTRTGAGVLVGYSGAIIYALEMVRMRRICLYCMASTAGFVSGPARRPRRVASIANRAPPLTAGASVGLGRFGDRRSEVMHLLLGAVPHVGRGVARTAE